MENKLNELTKLIKEASKLTPEQLEALTETAQNRAAGMEWEEASQPVKKYFNA